MEKHNVYLSFAPFLCATLLLCASLGLRISVVPPSQRGAQSAEATCALVSPLGAGAWVEFLFLTYHLQFVSLLAGA